MSLTRRALLSRVGTAAVGIGGLSATTDTVAAGHGHGYKHVPTDTGTTLFDVVGTREGPFAVGLEGTMLRRGYEQYHSVTDGFPFDGNTHLYGIDVTDDGRRVWVAGDDGTLAEYDVVTGEFFCHEIVDDDRAFVDVGATGTAGEGTVYVVDGRGHVFYTFDYGGSWKTTMLGHGVPPVALDRFGMRGGLVLDIDGCVYRTVDGKKWEQFTIEELDRYVFDIAGGRYRGGVVGEDGLVICRDREGIDWHVLGDTDLLGVDYRQTDWFGAVVGFEGTLFEFDEEWERFDLATDLPLFGIYVGEYLVAVGDDGTVFEKW
ncbi:hypothetical protein [Halosegnis sp.]|uniref:hypothetical protein n=1 Tax=Halosegnis sp. TaxID=2864959 RepID=UPI0035D4E193